MFIYSFKKIELFVRDTNLQHLNAVGHYNQISPLKPLRLQSHGLQNWLVTPKY